MTFRREHTAKASTGCSRHTGDRLDRATDTMNRVKRMRWILFLVGLVLILNIIATIEGLTIPLYADI